MKRYIHGADSRQPNGSSYSSRREHVFGQLQPMDEPAGSLWGFYGAVAGTVIALAAILIW